MYNSLPLFPLSTLLFPQGQLELRLFEPRYLDMLTSCLKEESGFGVVLLEQGSEVGSEQSFFNVGTEASIVDWDSGDDGMLHITTIGERRFVVETSSVQADGLVVGSVEWLDEPDDLEIPTSFRYLLELLENVVDRTGANVDLSDARRDSALWLGYRLAEILPLEGRAKTELLAVSDPISRLEHFDELLRQADLEA